MKDGGGVITKSYLKILIILYKNGCDSEIKTFPISKLVQQSKLSISTVRKIIKALLSMDYIKQGISDWKAKTYYISELGIEYLNNKGVN